MASLNSYPFDFILGDRLLAPIVDSGRFGVRVRGHLLRFFELRVEVVKVRGDASAAARVVWARSPNRAWAVLDVAAELVNS